MANQIFVYLCTPSPVHTHTHRVYLKWQHLGRILDCVSQQQVSCDHISAEDLWNQVATVFCKLSSGPLKRATRKGQLPQSLTHKDHLTDTLLSVSRGIVDLFTDFTMTATTWTFMSDQMKQRNENISFRFSLLYRLSF